MNAESRPSESAGQRLRRWAGVRIGRFEQEPPSELSKICIPPPAPLPDDPPTVSITVPSLNQGRYIRRTLASVLDQAYPRLELRVQDGGSTDSTLQELADLRDPSVEVVVEPDEGQSDAINRGLSHASGDLMAWLNADDLLLPGSIQNVVAYFDAHAHVDVVYGDRLIIDSDDRVVGRWILPEHDPAVLRWIDYVPQETLFWRRSAWAAAGARVDPELHFAMDWDLLLRMAAAGSVIHHIPRLIGAFRIHPQQKTQAALREAGRPEMATLRNRHCRGIDRIRARFAHARYLGRHRRVDRAFQLGLDAGPPCSRGQS